MPARIRTQANGFGDHCATATPLTYNRWAWEGATFSLILDVYTRYDQQAHNNIFEAGSCRATHQTSSSLTWLA